MRLPDARADPDPRLALRGRLRRPVVRHIVRRGAAGIGLPFQRLDLVRSAPDSAPAVRGAADDHIGWSGGYQQWFGSGTDCGCGKDHALQVLDVIWDEEGREGIDGEVNMFSCCQILEPSTCVARYRGWRRMIKVSEHVYYVIK